MLMTIKHDTEMGWGYNILDANGCVMIMSVKPYSTFGAVIADLHDFMSETVFIA